eukprot:6213056-Pleurochrysis_carterae.AAC.5
MAKRQYVVKGTTFEVDERYEVKKGVGQGAYGLICAAKDTVTGENASACGCGAVRTCVHLHVRSVRARTPRAYVCVRAHARECVHAM